MGAPLALLKKPSFAIFIACMFLICVPLYFYFVNMNMYVTELGWSYTAAKMSLAQVSDVIFLILLPLMLKKLGYKKTIFIGILAWTTRYFLLSGSVSATSAQTTLIFAAILLHGVCYDFLFIAGQLYVDDESNERIRGESVGVILTEQTRSLAERRNTPQDRVGAYVRVSDRDLQDRRPRSVAGGPGTRSRLHRHSMARDGVSFTESSFLRVHVAQPKASEHARVAACATHSPMARLVRAICGGNLGGRLAPSFPDHAAAKLGSRPGHGPSRATAA